MGNFEKLSVVVIVVIIVMILAVAVVEWTSGPAETAPATEPSTSAVVNEPPPRIEPMKAEPKKTKPPIKKDEAAVRDPDMEGLKIWDEPFNIESGAKKATDTEKDKGAQPGKGEPVAPPAPGTTPDIAETTHVVASGETLGAISKKYYDRVSLWSVIVEANPGLRPESLRPGQTLKIPARKGVPLVAQDGNAHAAAQAGPGVKPVPGKEYTVRTSDTWERISSAAYNTSARWPEIYLKNLNRVKDQKDLPPGKVIMIPK